MTTNVSRRSLLALGAGLGATTMLGGSALAKAPKLGTQSPYFHRFILGAAEVTVVSDGVLPLGDPSGTFIGVPKEEIKKMLSDNFLSPDNVVLEQNSPIVNTGDKLVLFDTGMGASKAFGPTTGRQLKSMAEAGIKPEEIDAVVCSHAHIDHIGGIVDANDKPLFPNAQIYIAQSDFEFWTDEKKLGGPQNDFVVHARKNLLPVRDRLVFFNGAARSIDDRLRRRRIRDGALTARRPFRSPHHSASMAALTGGGIRAKPGEISLAHQGVLFLDGLPEFDPRVLDSLRQPLENGEDAVSRANHRVTYPARFMLVAAMNPCRCGHAYEPGYSCKRGRVDRCTGDYQARISGPLMDRIDLRIEVPAVTATDLILPPTAEGSAEVAARVAAARDIQLARYAAAGLPHIRTNAEAPASILETIAQPDAQGLKLLRDASETMRLSARGYHRVLRVAPTLADLDGAEKIGRLHLAEALSYRALADDLRRAA
jgi:glyoxylase-like metal-dependent hydrolase (beta-lactamase superfamily II)